MIGRDKPTCLRQTVITFENGKLVQIQKWDGKETTIEREIQDGKLTAVRFWAFILNLCIFRLHLTFFLPTEMHRRWRCGTKNLWEGLISCLQSSIMPIKCSVIKWIFVFVLILWVGCLTSSTNAALFPPALSCRKLIFFFFLKVRCS